MRSYQISLLCQQGILILNNKLKCRTAWTFQHETLRYWISHSSYQLNSHEWINGSESILKMLLQNFTEKHIHKNYFLHHRCICYFKQFLNYGFTADILCSFTFRGQQTFFCRGLDRKCFQLCRPKCYHCSLCLLVWKQP